MIIKVLEVKQTKNPNYVSVFGQEIREGNRKSAKGLVRAWGVFDAALDLNVGDEVEDVEYTSKQSVTPFYEGQEPYTDGFYYENRIGSPRKEHQLVDAAKLQMERGQRINEAVTTAPEA